MERYIDDISDLNLSVQVNKGSCSEIYEYEPNILFKRFNEEYQDLTESINQEFYDTISYLSQIRGLNRIVTPIDIYRSKEQLFGYTMKKINAKSLEKVSEQESIQTIIQSFKELLKEIKILSNNYVRTEDIGGDNILYNGELYLLDLDLSLINKNYDPEYLYSKTSYNVFFAMHNFITGKISSEDNLEDERLILKEGFSNDYSAYFTKLLTNLENESNEKIETVEQCRKTYQRLYEKKNQKRI